MPIDIGNLYACANAPIATEQITPLLNGGRFRIERIVSQGHATPPGQWYDQSDNEWVVLLTGSATLHIEGEAAARPLIPGDWILLPAHLRHRVESTDDRQPTIWLAIHYISADAI